MMKKFFVLLAVMMLSFSLISCEDREVKKARLKNEKIALGYAKDYINKKYGFEPEVKSYISDWQHGAYNRQYIDKLIVEMSHDGKDFITYINYDGTNGKDSYQSEDIMAGLLDEINGYTNGTEMKDIEIQVKNDIRSYAPFEFNDYLCSRYFDGTDLSDILDECGTTFTAYYVDKELTPERSGLLKNTDGTFISFRSEEAMKKYREIRSVSNFPHDYTDKDFAPYIKYKKTTDGTFCDHSEWKTYDGFDYLSFGKATSGQWERPNELKSISKLPDGNDFEEIHDISEIYMAETNEDTALYIYFPVDSSIYTDDTLVVRYSIENKKTGETETGSEIAEICGEYANSCIIAGKNSEVTFCLAKQFD